MQVQPRAEAPNIERRHADHVLMLERIYMDPVNAPLLPSPEGFGEAFDWERRWRKITYS